VEPNPLKKLFRAIAGLATLGGGFAIFAETNQVSDIKLSIGASACAYAAALLLMGFGTWVETRAIGLPRAWSALSVAAVAILMGAFVVHGLRDRATREAMPVPSQAPEIIAPSPASSVQTGEHAPAAVVQEPMAMPGPTSRSTLHRRRPVQPSQSVEEPRESPKSTESDPGDRTGDRNAILSLKVVDRWERPIAATCIVDGVAAFPPYEWKVPAGPVHVTCRAEDFDDGFASIEIEGGETKHSKMVMTGKLGALSVLVRDDKDNPINATCWLEGGQPEKEPVNASGPTGWMRLLIAKHHLKCESPGYESADGDVMITEGFSTATVRLRKKN
jgi:hypothetical protein